MDITPNSVLVIDTHNLVIDMTVSLEPFIVGKGSKEKRNSIYRQITSITRDIVDDLITENLYWTKETTVATSDRYADRLDYVKEMIHEVLELFEHYIVELEDILYSKNLLPSWSFFEVISKPSYIIIHSHGDYRIEDWMKKYGKRVKRTRLCSNKVRR